VQAGAVIVSGLALGIDSVAHQAALDAAGDTIAVLGCGIDICYPPRNRLLFERIASDGLLLSEFAPGTAPHGFHFPHRNRIIALLSHALLLVEATHDSGSLTTTKRAAAHMEVLVVPGPLGRRTSEGCNRTIRDGGTIVLEPADILKSLHLKPAETNKAPEPVLLDEEAAAVWRSLSLEAQHVDDVAARTKLPSANVALALLRLELAGAVLQLPGSRFRLHAET
jgi:DNA processing protein